MIVLDDLKVYDVKECAEILQMHEQTVRRYTKRGLLKGQKVHGKQYYTDKTIEDFLSLKRNEKE